jgi:hypothetical protein
MKLRHLAAGVLAIVATTAPSGHAAPAGGPGGPGGNDAAAAFDRLKLLVGEWKGDAGSGGSSLSYELVANGTALIERESGGGRPTMMTMYHRDGDRLLLTHYCMAGNQPRMQARYDRAMGEIAFDFVDATNLANPEATHMHNVTIRFVDDNQIETVWQLYQKGKPANAERARYTRIH